MGLLWRMECLDTAICIPNLFVRMWEDIRRKRRRIWGAVPMMSGNKGRVYFKPGSKSERWALIAGEMVTSCYACFGRAPGWAAQAVAQFARLWARHVH